MRRIHQRTKTVAEELGAWETCPLLQRLADRVELLLVNQGELRRATSPLAAATQGGQCLSCSGPVGERDSYAAAGANGAQGNNAMYNRFGGKVSGAPRFCGESMKCKCEVHAGRHRATLMHKARVSRVSARMKCARLSLKHLKRL